MTEVRRAVAAAVATASSLGLAVDDAVVLQRSNRVTARLLPCDVVTQVAPAAHGAAQLEVGVARQLAGSGCPVAALDPRVEPRVHERDGFAVVFWTHYEAVPSAQVPPAAYADALRRTHAGLRALGVAAPRAADRVASAQRLVASRDRTPALAEADRELLGDVLQRLGGAVAARGGEQLLHGEPHPGNLLATADGPVLIDLETCCRGPVEFDVAHAPDAVADHYPGLDHDLLRRCRTLVRAVATTWRWDRDDRLPDGRRLGVQWLGDIRTALERDG